MEFVLVSPELYPKVSRSTPMVNDTCILVCKFTHVITCIYNYIYIHVCMLVCMYACMHVCNVNVSKCK